MGTTTNSTPNIISNEKEALKTHRLHGGEKKSVPVHSWRILKILDLLLQVHLKNTKNILDIRIQE